MKKQTYIPFFLLVYTLFLLLPNSLFAKSEEIEKTIQKSFPIEKTGSLTISNQFGKVDLISHDKKTVEVTVKIIVDAGNEDKSKRKLEEIEIDFSATSSSVEMKTSFEKGKNNFNGSFQIDYTVKAPASLVLDLHNQFGDVFIGEWSGNTNIEVEYGNLTVGKLLADVNEISLQFSKGSIGLINKGNVKLAYADKFNLDKTKELTIRSSFSDYEIQTAEKIDCKSEYDEVEIENVNRIALDASFSSVKIGKLYVHGDVSNEYGSIKIGQVSKGFEGLDLENSFASIKVDFEQGTSFTFECEAEYGDVSVPSGSDIRIDKKDHSEHYLKGKVGSGENLPHVSVEVDYGSANLSFE